jgi:hypothetical protein
VAEEYGRRTDDHSGGNPQRHRRYEAGERGGDQQRPGSWDSGESKARPSECKREDGDCAREGAL